MQFNKTKNIKSACNLWSSDFTLGIITSGNNENYRKNFWHKVVYGRIAYNGEKLKKKVTICEQDYDSVYFGKVTHWNKMQLLKIGVDENFNNTDNICIYVKLVIYANLWYFKIGE